MKEAILYEQLGDSRVQCHVCRWRCSISDGRRGRCRTRINRGGTLYTLVDDQVSSVGLDPIEKKPLYHFHPGSRVYSIGTLGCSFCCPGCQNWQISQQTPLEDDPSLARLTPAQAVEQACWMGAAGICWTYNEPAIWLEHTLEGAKLAKTHALYTAYVTNGSATTEHLDLIGPYLDAYRVDLKAFTAAGYRTIAGFADVEGILESARYARERWGMHVECVTNVTPTVNDSDEELRGMANWIATALGVDTPWHLTRFHPYEGFAHLPVTPMERLDRAYAIGRDAGLRYVYVGNVPGDARQDTICPSCDHVVIRRCGFSVARTDLRNGACARCGTTIAGQW